MCVWSMWMALKASWWVLGRGICLWFHPVHELSAQMVLTARRQEPFIMFDQCFSLTCRKDQNLLSPVNCWYLLLNQVRRESKDHATLSDIYLNNVIMRFMQISEDSTRLMKKVSVFDYISKTATKCSLKVSK